MTEFVLERTGSKAFPGRWPQTVYHYRWKDESVAFCMNPAKPFAIEFVAGNPAYLNAVARAFLRKSFRASERADQSAAVSILDV